MTESSTLIPDPTIAMGFHALSDPLRIRILELLREQEFCVCDLCERLATSQSKLSFHLKILKVAGLVRSRQVSRWIYYSLDPAQFTILEQYLAQFHSSTTILPARICED